MDSLQSSGPGGPGSRPAVAFDTASILQKVASAQEARCLPCGAIIGDRHGGLTFTDAVAAVLESRSLSGWQEVASTGGEIWTVIVVDR